MKFYNRLNLYLLAPIVLFFICCKQDILDRPPLTTVVDDNFWRNEMDVRLYADGFYENYFIGYNTAQTQNYAPYFGSHFDDDQVVEGIQPNFANIVPPSRVSNSTTPGGSWILQHGGPTWNFFWVRKVNIFIDRLDNVARPNLTEEEYNHWMAVARFFRGMEYSRLVSVFGDVPHFDRIVEDNDSDYMYKDRDDRGYVMDRVYEDFEFVLANMRSDDGKQYLNRNIAAAFISRYMLFEGSFLHYHHIDAERAEKYLQFAVNAAEIPMDSGQYSFTSDYKSLFASENLDGNREVMLWREYDASLLVMHSVLARQNGTQSQTASANLDFVKSFLCVDGQPWQNSNTANASSFSLQHLVASRDSRFEATILGAPNTNCHSLFYTYKHAPRGVQNHIGGNPPLPSEWLLALNTTDAPIIRFAEVVLNWVEAKTILAEAYGGSPIVQSDLDASINAIRNRPLAPEAVAKGVQKTVPLSLASLPNDPDRDTDVSALLWEIRRERRVEFHLEQTRLLDLKRWKKMHYMDYSSKPDYLLGPWVDFSVEMPSRLVSGAINVLKVRKQDGTTVTYNGSNANAMVGYYMIPASNRQPFGDEVYLAAVGEAQIVQYEELGYKLTQTVNW